MKKLYYLATCSTCIRIIKSLELDKQLEMQDIKTEKITESQLDQMANMAGSYEALFSRKAMKYKSMGLKDRVLNESDYKKLILEEYTFLKRPVAIVEDRIFIGNAKNTIEQLGTALSN
ncbi:MAG: ArsC/Spx/MgsR family protein [Chitinophagales bacterium]